jgi:hypothetical protein
MYLVFMFIELFIFIPLNISNTKTFAAIYNNFFEKLPPPSLKCNIGIFKCRTFVYSIPNVFFLIYKKKVAS